MEGRDWWGKEEHHTDSLGHLADHQLGVGVDREARVAGVADGPLYLFRRWLNSFSARRAALAGLHWLLGEITQIFACQPISARIDIATTLWYDVCCKVQRVAPSE